MSDLAPQEKVRCSSCFELMRELHLSRAEVAELKKWQAEVRVELGNRFQEIKGLRAALEFYAENKNWMIPSGKGYAVDFLLATCPVQDDNGTTARIALEKQK